MDQFPTSRLSALATSQSGVVEMSLDTQDFGGQGLNQFDLDFLLDETDLLSNYLIGIFPPKDLPQQIHDGPSSFVDNAGGRAANMENIVGSSTVALDPVIIGQPPRDLVTVPPASEHITVQHVPANDIGIGADDDADVRDEAEVPNLYTRGATEPEMQTTMAGTEGSFDTSSDAPLDGLDAMADDIWSANPWVISPAAFTRLEALVRKHTSSTRDSTESSGHGMKEGSYRLPSRQVLSRYVMNFVRSFHPHLPFLHLGTTCLDDLDPVLLMTLAATGSFYGFEHTRGYAMYAVAKSVIIYELDQRRRTKTAHLTQSFPAYAEIPMPMSTSGEPPEPRTSDQQPQTSRDPSSIMLLQSLLVLLLTMLWLDGPLMEDALAMSSQLTEILRDTLREEEEDERDGSNIGDGQTGANWTQSTKENIENEEERDDFEDGERAEKTYRDTEQELAWKQWGRREERLRTFYSAYFVLNILAICFGVPHPLSSRELDLVLPSSEAEFAAPTWIEWLRLRRRKSKASQKQPTAQWQERGTPAGISDEQRPRFLTCLHQLLAGQRLAKEVAAREYGNYMLVQTLVIHINRERQVMADRPASSTAAPSSSPLPQPQSQPSFTSLPPDIVSLYGRALNAWQAGWDSAIDASPLDPNAVHGPLAFNATAMLRLAHVQLVMGWSNVPLCRPGEGRHSMYRRAEVSRHLRCREPRTLALGWPGQPRSSPSPRLSPRSPHVHQAVVHAICALRIPVRVGIPFVARGRTGHWSVQHALSTFSCAQLLAHWLEAMYEAVRDGAQTETAGSYIESVAQPCAAIDVLRNDEKRLLGMVERLIEETHLAESLGQPGSYPGRIRRLTVAALKLWADTCKGIQVFEIVHVVGATLSIVAEGLEDDEWSGRGVR